MSGQVEWDISYAEVEDKLVITFKGQPKNNSAAQCVCQNWLQYLEGTKESKALWYGAFESNFPTSFPKKTGVKVVSPLVLKDLHIDRVNYHESYFILEQSLTIKPEANGYKVRCSIVYDDVQYPTNTTCGFYSSALKCFKISSDPHQMVSKTACEYISRDGNE